MPIRLKERPIFMIGAERSGTTLVMALLGCHSRISVPEVCMKSHVWHGCACLSGNHILACILTKQVRKGKTNRVP